MNRWEISVNLGGPGMDGNRIGTTAQGPREALAALRNELERRAARAQAELELAEEALELLEGMGS